MITPADLNSLELWERLKRSVGWDGTGFDDLWRHRLIRRLIGMEVSDLINTTHERLRDSRVRSAEELQSLSYNIISFSEDMHRRNRQLKDFLYTRLYRHPRVVRMQVKSERIITDMFNAFLSEPTILPRQFQDQIE